MPTKDKGKSKKLTQEEFEKKVLELAGKDLTSEKIGEELRKQHIHPKEYQKKISQILGDKYVIPEIKNIETKLEKIKKHSEKNKKDKRAMRDKGKIAARLRRMKKYFKKI
jgi:ribosomal protein S15P/S13E